MGSNRGSGVVLQWQGRADPEGGQLGNWDWAKSEGKAGGVLTHSERETGALPSSLEVGPRRKREGGDVPGGPPGLRFIPTTPPGSLPSPSFADEETESQRGGIRSTGKQAS